jgi:hypothetical protein
VTHWSARLLAEQLQIGFASVARIWRKWDLQPWRTETFKFSTDPELDAKIRDVVGLYVNPPEKAVVLCIDEKSQIQALDRTAPILPIRPGLPEKATRPATAPYTARSTASTWPAAAARTRCSHACAVMPCRPLRARSGARRRGELVGVGAGVDGVQHG